MSVSVVIPALNEESTIGEVVSVLTHISDIKEIIVVSDGSTDHTADVARENGARVIELNENIGKGGAMMVGVEEIESDVVLFLDADLIGLTPSHVEELITPVISDDVEMTIGIFENGRFATDLAQFVAPYLSGQRALRVQLLQNMSDLEISRFGIEVALTKYVAEHKMRIKEIELKGMSHVMKEEKLGLAKGLAARMKMYWEIAKVIKRGFHE